MAIAHISWKRRLGNVLRRVPKPADRRVLLIYHSIGETPFALPEFAFREQVEWLAEHSKVATIDEIVRGSNPDLTGLCVGITFDDGYSSVREIAAPILARAAFPATLYINSSSIGEHQRAFSDASEGHYPGETFLLWNEVVELTGMGWTVGSHGVEHVDLTSLPRQEVHRQVTDSKQAIEKRIGTVCDHFAYTWGRHNNEVRAAVTAAGYRSAVAGVHGPVRCDSDRYALPRVDVRRDYSLDDFIAIVRGDWDYLGLVQKARGLFQ